MIENEKIMGIFTYWWEVIMVGIALAILVVLAYLRELDKSKNSKDLQRKKSSIMKKGLKFLSYIDKAMLLLIIPIVYLYMNSYPINQIITITLSVFLLEVIVILVWLNWKKIKSVLLGKEAVNPLERRSLQVTDRQPNSELDVSEIMQSYRKKRCKQFPDIGFKLVVVNEILENEIYPTPLTDMIYRHETELDRMEKEDLLDDDWTDPRRLSIEILDYVVEMEIPQEYLEKITSLSVHSGNMIYDLLYNWDLDAEAELFDIHSVEGYELLSNLKEFTVENYCENPIYQPLKDKKIKISEYEYKNIYR